MRLICCLALMGLVACSDSSDQDDVASSTSIMIIGAVVPSPDCTASVNSERLKRGIFDIKDVRAGNAVGLEYVAYLVMRDQTQSGVGSKKLVVEYDYSSNLIQPTSATRNSLRQELTIPFAGWTEGALETALLVTTAPVIPEHVTDLLANDPNIAAELRRNDTVMNTVSGLAGYYTVQIKIQALDLGKNGQWLRSPPYFITVDLCDGCLQRKPQQLVPDDFTATCRRTQDQIYYKLKYPLFPDLSGKTEGPDDEGDVAMPLITSNAGLQATLGSMGAKRLGRSNTGVWLATPNHAGKDDFLFNGIEVAEPGPFAQCGVGDIAPGNSEICTVPSYPRLCDDGTTGCTTDTDCGGGGTCVASTNLRITVEGELVDVHCGVPSLAQNNNNGDAGPTPDGGQALPPADGGLPVVACLYIVCADVDNEVLEWDKVEDWEKSANNCTCYSEDSDLVEYGCPL